MRDYEINTRGHRWKLNEDGSVDIFGFEYGYHNGPVCVVCGYGFCHHCQDGPDMDCTKIIDVPAQTPEEQP